MKQKLISAVVCSIFAFGFAYGALPRVDSLAVFILSKSNITLLNLNSCNFTAHTTYDVWGNELGVIEHAQAEKVYFEFPDKLFVNSIGDKGHKSLWYNGKTLSLYSYGNNTYAETSAPSDILKTIDTVNKVFGVEFPAADFFYPTFVEDILNTGCNLIYLGLTKVGDKDCFHIAGKSETASFQFWISSDELFLPVKISIIYLAEKGIPRYEAVFSNWELNSVFVDSMFEFTAPPKATKVKFLDNTKAKK